MLPPATTHIHMAPTTKFIMVCHIMRTRTRRAIPVPTMPLPPATFPKPISADPNEISPWRGGLGLHQQGRWRGIYINFATRRAGLHVASRRQQAGTGKNQHQFDFVVRFHSTELFHNLSENIRPPRQKSTCQAIRKTLIETSYHWTTLILQRRRFMAWANWHKRKSWRRDKSRPVSVGPYGRTKCPSW